MARDVVWLAKLVLWLVVVAFRVVVDVLPNVVVFLFVVVVVVVVACFVDVEYVRLLVVVRRVELVDARVVRCVLEEFAQFEVNGSHVVVSNSDVSVLVVLLQSKSNGSHVVVSLGVEDPQSALNGSQVLVAVVVAVVWPQSPLNGSHVVVAARVVDETASQLASYGSHVVV